MEVHEKDMEIVPLQDQLQQLSDEVRKLSSELTLLRGFVETRFGKDYKKYLESDGSSTTSIPVGGNRPSTSKAKMNKSKKRAILESASLDHSYDDNNPANTFTTVNVTEIAEAHPETSDNSSQIMGAENEGGDLCPQFIIAEITLNDGDPLANVDNEKQNTNSDGEIALSSTDGNEGAGKRKRRSSRSRDRSIRRLGSLTCQWCGEVLNSSVAKTRHIRKFHPSPGQVPTILACPFCQTKISRIDNLKAHVKLVHKTTLPVPYPPEEPLPLHSIVVEVLDIEETIPE